MKSVGFQSVGLAHERIDKIISMVLNNKNKRLVRNPSATHFVRNSSPSRGAKTEQQYEPM